MTCDATSTDELIAGDDWVWDYSTTDDISDWDNMTVQIRSGQTPGSPLLASTDPTGDEAPIHTDGGIGSLAATDFATGVVTWWIDRADTAPLALNGSTIVYLEASVEVGGVLTTVWPASEFVYTVRPQVAVEVTGS